MIRTVAAKEFRALARDPRVRLTAVILVLMLLVSLLSAISRFADVSQERAAAQALINEQWANQGEKNPHAAAHYGIYAIRPVTPLSFFDTGITSFAGVSIWLEAHRRNLPGARPADDNTAAGPNAELTAAYTLQVLLPLFIILLSFQAFAGEREQGTLRQLLGTGVAPFTLLAGKAIGIAAAAAVVVAPVIVVGLIGLCFAPGGLAELPAAIAIGVAYGVYALIFLFLSLAVSARLATSQAALVALLAFWAVSSFVLPRISADLAAWRYPLPSAVELESRINAEIESGLDGRNPAEIIDERRRTMLAMYKADSVDDLPINFQGIIFALREELDAAVFAKHFGDVYTRLEAQQSMYGTASLLSPRMAIELTSMNFAGSGLTQQIDFANHAEQYRMKFIETLNQDLTINSKPGQTDYRSGPELWQRIGDYQYPGLSLARVVQTTLPLLLVLAIWLAATVGAAWLAMRRLRITV
ncbi:MAG: DUF3526 domain-containing protein [Gammaproteobacteria bacterium]|nr:DUF3526 domain-containing protein [Gammaproteobacteria bacterium]